MKQIKYFILMMILTNLLHPSDGELNPSFGINGMATIPQSTFQPIEGFQSLQVTTLFIDADGSYIIGGFVQSQQPPFIIQIGYLARLTKNGQFDSSFNAQGSVPGMLLFNELTSLSNFEQSICNQVIILPDGSIVGVGTASGTNNVQDILVINLNPDGTLNSSFNNGQPITDDLARIDVTRPQGFAVALSASGALTVTGECISQTPTEIPFIARYTRTGMNDTTFNGTGAVTLSDFDMVNLLSYGTAVALDSDDNIVIAGLLHSPEWNLFVARYKPDGSPDTSFGPGTYPGLVLDTMSLNGYNIQLVIQKNGNIVAAGTITPVSGGNYSYILRYTPNGSPDLSFNNGLGYIAFNEQSSPLPLLGEQWGLCLQDDQKIVGVGYGYVSFGQPLNVYLYRLTTSGTLDSTFGNGGITVIPVSDIPGIFGSIGLNQNGFPLVCVSQAFNLLSMEYIASPSLVTTTITDPQDNFSGSAQANGIVELFEDTYSTLLCSTHSLNDTWSCTASVSQGKHMLFAVTHYPAGNVLIKSNFFDPCKPIQGSALSIAIQNKYCPC